MVIALNMNDLTECKEPKPRLKTVQGRFKGEELWQTGWYAYVERREDGAIDVTSGI